MQHKALTFVLMAFLALWLGGCAETESGFSVRNTSRTFTTVVLDPGHGGYDSGACIRKGPAEKDLTLDVVRRLAPKLREAGFRTIITRKSDVFIPLDTRAQISAPEKKPDDMMRKNKILNSMVSERCTDNPFGPVE